MARVLYGSNVVYAENLDAFLGQNQGNTDGAGQAVPFRRPEDPTDKPFT